MKRILRDKYVPTLQDILYIRKPTIGVIEHIFRMDNLTYRLVWDRQKFVVYNIVVKRHFLSQRGGDIPHVFSFNMHYGELINLN